ncbi:MAG: hypothetical protein ACPKM1_18170 [Spirochaetaceae bacterium]
MDDYEDVEYFPYCGAELEPGYDCPCGAIYDDNSGEMFQEKYDLYANEY